MKDEQKQMVQSAIETYASNQIDGASSGQLLLITYDFILKKLRAEDAIAAKRGVVELMGALNMKYLDAAGPLFRLYEYCLDIIRVNKYEEALEIFDELRVAWKRVIELAAAEQGHEVGATQV